MTNSAIPVLQADDIYVSYQKSSISKRTFVVRGVSLQIKKGETVGLVGESGCGKTTLGKSLLRLIPVQKGSITVNGLDWLTIKNESFRKQRRSIGVIFQNPFGSLNPKMTVLDILTEAFLVSGTKRANCKELSIVLLNKVGIESAAINKYPHEFSGGQCQRIAIARALAISPSLIIADEPVSSLDVSVQAQILNLFMDLKKEHLAMLFISHDLSVVKYISERIAVMYNGIIVESAPTPELFSNPLHPYTRLLLNSIPQIGVPKLWDVEPDLKPESQADITAQGCPFFNRCTNTTIECSSQTPSLINTNNPDHQISCFRYHSSTDSHR